MRSKLFVPGSRPEFFAKALASEADALSFDLEDSVPAGGKAEARDRLAEFMAGAALRASGKTLIVRINPLDTPDGAADRTALAGLAIDLINLPKVEDAATVVAAARALDEAGCDPAIRLLVNVESPLGLARAAEIAAADPRVAGLQVGLNDLFAPLGIDRTEPRHVHAALWSVRMAAAAAGCFAYDGAWPGIADETGFRAEAELARSLGFLGKSCIHPRQVPIANVAFGRGDAVARAQRLVAAAADAEARGLGAFRFDGEMIDRPAIAAAQAVLAQAEENR